MNISIEKAQIGDIGILAEIHSASLIAAFGNLFPEELVIEQFSPERRLRGFGKELKAGEPVSYIVYDESEPIGVLSYGASRYFEAEADSIELWRIYFMPGYWGRGASAEAMDLILEEIRKEGYKKVFLWVLEENTRARRFYEKYGFAETSRILDTNFGRPVREIMYEITL